MKRNKRRRSCWIGSCKAPTKPVTEIRPHGWFPTVKQRLDWDMCTKCGEATVNGLHSMESEKVGLAVFLNDKLTDKQMHFALSYLNILRKNFEAALKLQKKKLKPLRDKKPLKKI